MTTEVVPDVEAIEHLDFDHELVCEYEWCGKGNPAKWIFIQGKCGCTWLLCDLCAEYIEQKWRNWGGWTGCRRCYTMLEMPKDHHRIEPLP